MWPRSQTRKVALNSAKISLLKGKFGRFKGHFPAVVAQKCFSMFFGLLWGPGPQALYNRSQERIQAGALAPLGCDRRAPPPQAKSK